MDSVRSYRLLQIFVALISSVAAADERPAGRVFDRQVAPILSRHCGECHNADSAELELDLSSEVGVLRGSESGAVIVPGNGRESRLLHVLDKDAKPHMPPDGQLADEEIAVIAGWIDGLDASTQVGAERLTEADRDHWAFRPLKRPAVPPVGDSGWLRNPIDRFVLARLEAAGMTPSPPAEKTALLRRVYFDLVGLPPSPDDVMAFLADDGPGAYQRVVERLLASPRYGERWGRHWLDLARYADSSGFHNDIDRPNAWRYRDYVIAAFNADAPYGRFIHEQLAGDQLAAATAQSWIATGFCRNGPTNEDNMGMGLEKEKYRLDELDDVVSTTSTVFLGLTLGCARCHDHKYDPISQRDYYRFLAFFDSAQRQQLLLNDFQPQAPALQPDKSKPDAKKPAAMVFTNAGQKPRTTHILWRGDVTNRGPAVEPALPALFAEPMRDDRSRLGLQPDHPEYATESASPSAADISQQSRLDLARWIADETNPLTWRVMANRIWHYHFGRGLVASPSNFGRLGERPTHPELLDWLAGELRRSGGSVKSLHRLIVTSAVYRQSSLAKGQGLQRDPQNRLLWRMNKRRLEAEPLRDAVLAVAGSLNLEMGGPGIKPRIRPNLLEASQRNKWPVVAREGPEHWRRSVYVYVKRQLQLPLLKLFDAPATTHTCARREESMVPTQALVLMNDDFIRQQAGLFADRVVREVAIDSTADASAGDQSASAAAAQAERALFLALGSPPRRDRVEEAVAWLEEQTKLLMEEGMSEANARLAAFADFCQVLLNLNEFLYID